MSEDFPVDEPQSAETLQPATFATKQAIFGCIEEKMQGGTKLGGTAFRHLSIPNNDAVKLTVFKWENPLETRPEGRTDLLAEIRKTEKVVEGNFISTKYLVIRSPDGLQLEMHSNTHNQNDASNAIFSALKPSDVAAGGISSNVSGVIEQIEAEKSSQAAERELGLGFVSEQDATTILTLLQEAQFAN